jgi:diguanylate cyclase (GGDEF)-like protein
MRPAPIADVPPAAIADGVAPAKAWLVALIAARDLHDAAAIPVAELSRDGPKLCAAILRAVGSDAAFDLPPVAAQAGAMAGAGSAASTVLAVGLLRRALSESLREAMPGLDAATTGALAERLAWVCDRVAAAAVSAPRGGEADAFRVRDAREAPAPPVHDWRAAATELLADGRTFALLAIEVDDVERLLASDPEVAVDALARAAQAVSAELRPADVLGREGDGRFWVVAAELGATGARALAERLADAVAAAATVRGAPLAISAGLAAAPADGADLDTLAARADEALFAARAAGVTLTGD